MGSSHSLPGVLPSSDLKVKSGKRTEPLAYPNVADMNNFEKIMRDTDFRDYLFKNIDNDSLISSLLQSNEISSSVSSFLSTTKTIGKDEDALLNSKVELFEKLAILGVKVV